MLVRRLWLTGFRNYAERRPSSSTPGLTVVLGDNGQGKTNLVEAMAFLATLESFRGHADRRPGAARRRAAVVRAEVVHADGRELLVEAEIGARAAAPRAWSTASGWRAAATCSACCG